LVKPKINKAFREKIPKEKKTQANATLSDKSYLDMKYFNAILQGYLRLLIKIFAQVNPILKI
jgi:hypothetical protein